MFFADRLQLGTTRRTKEGYLATRARAARAGIYDYLGRELDPEGKHFAADQVVKVYRPEEEVFAQDSVHSFLLKPITNDHPAQPVTAANWKDYAKGVNAGALRDGEYLAFDLVIMDKALIGAVDAGKVELSNGYGAEFTIGAGITDTGEHYDAVMSKIRGNHVAVVDKGRAGDRCRIGDAGLCDAATVDLIERLLGDETYGGGNSRDKNATDTGTGPGGKKMATDTIILDGLTVDLTDAAATKAAITKLQGLVDAANKRADDAETKVGTLTADVATKDGEIAGLQKKLEDAEISPDKLQQLAADRAALIEQAKALDPNIVTDGKSDAEIRKAAVTAKLGDKAPADDNGIAGAFAALTADAKPDLVRDALRSGTATVTDASAVRDMARQMQYN